MWLQINFSLSFYGIFSLWCNFATVEALVGDNVRSAEEFEFPFIVAIIKSVSQNDVSTSIKCGGTLISRNDVLTSEHCLSDEILTGINVLVGSTYLTNAIRYYPEWWISYDQWAVYNNYEIRFPNNDIMILNLLDRVPDTIEVAHIGICSITSLYGAEAQTAGWGYLQNNRSTNVLQTAYVTIRENAICELRASRIARQTLTMDERIICSISNPYVLLTDGDSGGPLLYANLLIGINHGTAPLSHNVLNTEDINVYYHVTYYYDFISNTRDDF